MLFSGESCMLGLPSTTDVGRRIPKEAFYRNLSINASLRQSFIDDVDHFNVANSIKLATTGIPDGGRVHEILVVEAALKSRLVPREVLACVARANPHKLLFVCTYGDEACLAVLLKALVVGEWRPLNGLGLELGTQDLDAAWDSLASQVAFGDVGEAAVSVEERAERAARLAELRAELARAEARGRKERQVARRNAMFEKVKELKRRIADIEEGR